MKHYRITVSGRVQGVFYRQSTLEVAKQLGIKGFVRNEPNGNVYIEAEGDVALLNALLEWCRKGPARAVVTGVEYEESGLKNHLTFEILR